MSTIWPSSSSVPIARTSARTRWTPASRGARCRRAETTVNATATQQDASSFSSVHVLDRREHVRADREQLEDGLPLPELARRAARCRAAPPRTR